MRRECGENAVVCESLEGRRLMSATSGHVEPSVARNVASWTNVSADPLFAPGGPSINDIHQGEAADCWFVASLGEVALRDPGLIRHDIRQLSDGTYDIHFHTTGGAIVAEHIDGLLPVDSDGGLVYASLGTDNCTWVAILEKALTYFRNQSIPPAYTTIGWGSGNEALTDLGGAVTEMLPQISNAGVLFKDVAKLVSSDKAVDFCTLLSGAGPLVNGHVYSVIATAVNSRGIKEIEVRNPWGWNPGFKAKEGFDATNDGYIWVKASAVLPELDEVASAIV